MKKFSFKIITTLWITLLITAVCTLSVSVLMIMSREAAEDKLCQTIVNVVESNADETEYSNQIFEVENDFIFYTGEIYCDLFSKNGEYIAGETPQSLIEAPVAATDSVVKTEFGGKSYYIYTSLLSYNKLEYEIDVLSGKIISYEADVAPSRSLEAAVYSETYFKNGISTSQAIDIALKHAGLTKEAATIISVSLPAYRDRQVFKIELTADKTSYNDIYIRGICPADAATQAFDAVGKSAFYIFPLFILLAAAGAYIISKRTVKPIEQITKSAQEITQGSDLSKRLEANSTSVEIAELSETFNEMLSRLQASFESERRFTSDASHELRTPLAVIKAECEYALSASADGDDKTQALESIEEQTDKMAALVSSLLAITRAEQGTKRFNLEKGNLSEITQEACNSFKTSKNITLTSDIQQGIEINMNSTLILQLIGNLISNAEKYGKENGSITVTLSEENGNARLTVRDDGIGISQEDLPKIWNRFYRADASRGETEGFGLGLALVKMICDIHSAECFAESEKDKYSLFTVIFKKI